MIRHKDQQILQMFLAAIPADRLQLLIQDHDVDLLQVAHFILYNLVLELHECVLQTQLQMGGWEGGGLRASLGQRSDALTT